MITCELCNREVSPDVYLPGFKKCFDCIDLIKDMHREGKFCTCLRLVYRELEDIDQDELYRLANWTQAEYEEYLRVNRKLVDYERLLNKSVSKRVVA